MRAVTERSSRPGLASRAHVTRSRPRLSRRPQRLHGSRGLHPGPVREQEQVRPQGGLYPRHVCHRHQQHPIRLRRRDRRHHRQKPAGLWPLLSPASLPAAQHPTRPATPTPRKWFRHLSATLRHSLRSTKKHSGRPRTSGRREGPAPRPQAPARGNRAGRPGRRGPAPRLGWATHRRPALTGLCSISECFIQGRGCGGHGRPLAQNGHTALRLVTHTQSPKVFSYLPGWCRWWGGPGAGCGQGRGWRGAARLFLGSLRSGAAPSPKARVGPGHLRVGLRAQALASTVQS